MLRMSNDWKTLLWFYLSLSWLVVLILIFWIKAPEGSKTFQTALVSPSPINQGSLVIQLEKAEISRVSDSGKEWEIHTDDLSKDGENIYLNGVQGFLYQGNQPQYQVQAKRGQVDIENSDALKAITSLSAAIRFMVRRTDKRTDIGNTYTKKEGRLYKKTWAMVINGTLD
jgi:hypothetical protein